MFPNELNSQHYQTLSADKKKDLVKRVHSFITEIKAEKCDQAMLWHQIYADYLENKFNKDDFLVMLADPPLDFSAGVKY